MRKHALRKSVVAGAVVCIMLMTMPLNVFAASKVSVPEDRVYITSTKYTLVPGATETVLTTNNSEGTDQRISYMLEVTPDTYTNKSIKIVAAYKDYQYEELGLQTVTDQAAAYEKAHPGEKVIAGINADFFNMTNGAPSGAFVMEGTVYNKVNGRPYFAILKDGTAVIRDGSHSDLSDVQEAVAGNEIIVTDGKVTSGNSDYDTTSYSRTAVGIKYDGSVMTYVTHGISRPTSCGETYEDVAKMMIAQGCQYALMLDGGGSSTYASIREGADTLEVQNSPSDGTPRTVSDTLLFVSTRTSDGVFDHVSITPNNEYYTPSTSSGILGLNKNITTVQFEAVGIDASGAVCPLPESGLTWKLSDDSSSMGEIDANTGLFTAAVDKVGTVGIEMTLNDKVVGSTEIQLVEPDELYFSGTALSLDFGASSDLGFNVRGNGVDLHIKDGDFEWTVEPSSIGTVSDNIFYSAEKQNETLEGTVSVKYTRSDGSELTADISVEIGKMPIVAMDFENAGSNIRGKDIVGLWDWGASGGYFSDTSDQQYYQFQNYETLYYLQSTTYAADSAWIDEVYATEQPWVENDDGTVSVTYNGKTYSGTKTDTYGQDGEKWVEFTDENGAGYYWRGLINQSNFSGNFNASRSASSILAADGYDMYVWHTSANPSISTGKLHGEGSQIVDSSEGEVRFGDYALKLTYDFTHFSPTGSTKNCNTYYRMANALKAEGSPTGLGMWVYAPEGMSNFWFWTQVTYWNGTKWADAYIHFRPSGAEQTCQYTGVNWTGWTYVEADLSAVYDAGAKVDADHPIQVRAGNPLILLTYIPGGTSDGQGHAIVCGSKTEGYFYIDDVRFVYGTNVDDMDSPQILSAKANDTELQTDEVSTLTTNDVVFAIDYTDPQGENYTGIDATATQLFLDGSVLSSNDFVATADRVQTVEMQLANGEHTLQISICDNFGNKTVQTYNFTVNNSESSIPTISINRENAAELGADYVVTIKADSLENIASVNTEIIYENIDKFETVKKTLSNTNFYDDYGNILTKGDDGNYYDPDGNLVEEPMRPNSSGDYSISSAKEILGENLTGSVRNKLANSTTRSFTASATVNDELTEDTTLAVFTLPVPHTLAEEDKLPYKVTVTYTTKDGATFTVTSGKRNASIWAYYTVTPGVQVSGAANSILTVTAADGNEVSTSGLKVYSDASSVVDGSFEGNVFTTEYFTAQEAGTVFNKVWVGDEENQHYSFYTTLSVASGAEADTSAFDLTLNATTGNSATSQHITWFSKTDSKKAAVVQYLTESAYDSAYDSAVSQAGSEEAVDMDTVFENAAAASGTAVLTQFSADNVAAYINNVEITGLSSSTYYVYRAGDGESWSEPSKFKTGHNGGGTSLFILGDTQLTGNDSEDAEAIGKLKSIGQVVQGMDLGIQTGDFVDGGIEYRLWDQILGVWGEAFPTLDFAHVMGNHEIYGTAGSTISPALFGLNSSERDYYSVEYGDVYIAVINQTAASDLSKAAEWLVEDAAKTDCTWKILTCHQPVYYTNPNGSSEGHNKILAPACDEAGIDFVFNGHDHSYARTEQIKDRVPVDLEMNDDNVYVDADGNIAATQGQGTVYFICGDLGEKSRESGYGIVDNPDFHFAKTSQSYDALYLTINADETKMTVNAWNMTDSGSQLIDTFTMYTGKGACASSGEHVVTPDEVKYNAETGMLICDRCGEEINPEDLKYTGYAVDVNGPDEYGDSQYYFLAGKLKTGFFAMGEVFLYANEAGLIDHATENYTTNTCTENGNMMAYSPRYEKTYKGGIARYTGHVYEEQEDGSLKCSVCQHVAIDISDWDYSLKYSSMTYDGTAKTPAIIIKNPETGETLDFHTDGTGIMSDYTRIWSNNRNVGTATVVVEANSKGDYTSSKGPVTLQLKICPQLPTDVSAAAGDIGSVNLTWKASATADHYVVYYSADGSQWKKAGDTSETTYEVTGLNQNTEYYFRIRSQATVDGQVYNSLQYTSPVTATTVSGYDLSGYKVETAWKLATYNGNAKRPTVTVTDPNGTILVKNTDYKVTYSDNVNVGTATAKVTGTGDYYGESSTTFQIKAQNFTDTGSLSPEDTVYAGGPTTTILNVKDMNGRILEEGKDYTASYVNNEAVGSATVTITGTGNYSGTMTANFLINQADVAELDAWVDEELHYTGSELTPAIKMSGMEEGTDYSVIYKDNINVGEASAIITGSGNYTGTKTIKFTILPAEIEGSTITDAAIYRYTGKEIKADISVVSALGIQLIEDSDYKVTGYTNNIEVGTATVEIEGIGNYTGKLKHDYVIQEADIVAMTVTLEPDKYVFTGGNKVPNVIVTNSEGTVLHEDEDYTVEIKDNRNAGVASVIITGKGNYSGTVIRNFTIEPADLTECTAEISYASTTFSGSDKEPTVTVTTKKGTVLKKDTNYTVTYLNNREAGTATVVITGTGNYGGSIEKNFTIKPADLSKGTVAVKTATVIENGSEQKPGVTVKTAKGTTLKEGVHYSVEYSNNINPGTATVVVTGINSYQGTLNTTFKIQARTDLSGFAATVSYSKTSYTGSEKCPSVTVKTTNGTTLKKDVNYTVTYSNNINVGKATITIEGIGKYKGKIVKNFTIVPAVPTNLAVATVSKTTAKVTFDRSPSADKYYIYVDGTYKGCAKTVDYYTIRGLSAGTTYNVTVKAVKVIDGENLYSFSSKTLSVTTKK